MGFKSTNITLTETSQNLVNLKLSETTVIHSLSFYNTSIKDQRVSVYYKKNGTTVEKMIFEVMINAKGQYVFPKVINVEPGDELLAKGSTLINASCSYYLQPLDNSDLLTFNLKGEFKEGQIYTRFDVVYKSGSSYICKNNGISSIPPSIDWDILASAVNSVSTIDDEITSADYTWSSKKIAGYLVGNISGNNEGYIGETIQLVINNYESISNYNVLTVDGSTTAGKAQIEGNKINILLPETPGNFHIYLIKDDVQKEFLVNVKSPEIIKPVIILPEKKYINEIIELETFTPKPANYFDHISTDWQISTDESFTSTILNEIASTENKTTLKIPTSLLEDVIYIVRAKFNAVDKENNLKSSEWSNIAEFTLTKSTGLILNYTNLSANKIYQITKSSEEEILMAGDIIENNLKRPVYYMFNKSIDIFESLKISYNSVSDLIQGTTFITTEEKIFTTLYDNSNTKLYLTSIIKDTLQFDDKWLTFDISYSDFRNYYSKQPTLIYNNGYILMIGYSNDNKADGNYRIRYTLVDTNLFTIVYDGYLETKLYDVPNFNIVSTVTGFIVSYTHTDIEGITFPCTFHISFIGGTIENHIAYKWDDTNNYVSSGTNLIYYKPNNKYILALNTTANNIDTNYDYATKFISLDSNGDISNSSNLFRLESKLGIDKDFVFTNMYYTNGYKKIIISGDTYTNPSIEFEVDNSTGLPIYVGTEKIFSSGGWITPPEENIGNYIVNFNNGINVKQTINNNLVTFEYLSTFKMPQPYIYGGLSYDIDKYILKSISNISKFSNLLSNNRSEGFNILGDGLTVSIESIINNEKELIVRKNI